MLGVECCGLSPTQGTSSPYLNARPPHGCSQTVSTARVQACKMSVKRVQSILVAGKPHLGTDRLIRILQAFRKHLTALGVKIHFGTCATGLEVQHDKVVGVKLTGMVTSRNACQLKVAQCILCLCQCNVQLPRCLGCPSANGHIQCYTLLQLQHHALDRSAAKLLTNKAHASSF